MPEQLHIHEAAVKADVIIDKSRENIPAEQKQQIAAEERKIRGALTNFKALPDYADIIECFKDDPDSDGHPPEDFLKMYTRRFEDMQKESSQEAHVKLEWLGADTLTKLEELKGNLGDAAAENERLNIAAQKMYERGLPAYDENPSHVTENLTDVGRKIGQMPNAEKLAAAELEFNSLLVHLRKRENATKYISANVNFQALTGGRKLEGVKAEIDKGIAKVAALASTDVSGARSALTTRFSAALDTFKVGIDVMSRSLVENKASHKETAETAESELLSPEELQFVLNVLLHGSQNPTFLEQLFDAETAYQFTTGRSYEQMNTAEKFLVVGVGQGVGNMGAFMGGLMLDPKETLKGLAEGFGSLFNPEVRARLGQVLKQGVWETMSPLEKSLLATQLVTDMLTGGALEGGAAAGLAKVFQSSKLVGLTGRMSSVARKAGVLEMGARLSLAVSSVAKTFPRLARFGVSAADIAKNMVDEASIITARLKVVAKKVQGPTRDVIETSASLVGPGATVLGERSDISKYLPAYADKVALEADLKTAAENAKAIGMSPQETVTVQAALRTLQSL